MNFTCPSTSVAHLPDCTIPVSYIRPYKGVAITPWIISFSILVAHAVSIVIRVFFQFESSQLLSITLAVYSIAVASSAFHSTDFDPNLIYAWSPVGLGLDVAGLLHLFVLICEKDGQSVGQTINSCGARLAHSVKRCVQWISDIFKVLNSWRKSLIRFFKSLSKRFDENATPEPNRTPTRDTAQSLLSPGINNLRPKDSPLATFSTIVVLSTLFLCVTALIILQLMGASRALQPYTRRHEIQLNDTWCSPAFPIGNVVFSSQCTPFDIDVRNGLNIGCIYSPGGQLTWLLGTGCLVVVQLCLEIFDIVFLLALKRQPYGQLDKKGQMIKEAGSDISKVGQAISRAGERIKKAEEVFGSPPEGMHEAGQALQKAGRGIRDAGNGIKNVGEGIVWTGDGIYQVGEQMVFNAGGERAQSAPESSDVGDQQSAMTGPRTRDRYTAPWITMLLAFIVSVALTAYGIWQTTTTPNGLPAGRVGIVTPHDGVCGMYLYPGGLRGTIIAWADSILSGLGDVYEPGSQQISPS